MKRGLVVTVDRDPATIIDRVQGIVAAQVRASIRGIGQAIVAARVGASISGQAE
ncbi:hypothetical protein [Nocardia sp. NPDC003183]